VPCATSSTPLTIEVKNGLPISATITAHVFVANNLMTVGALEGYPAPGQ
jgi:hypothetical protein